MQNDTLKKVFNRRIGTLLDLLELGSIDPKLLIPIKKNMWKLHDVISKAEYTDTIHRAFRYQIGKLMEELDNNNCSLEIKAIVKSYIWNIEYDLFLMRENPCVPKIELRRDYE